MAIVDCRTERRVARSKATFSQKKRKLGELELYFYFVDWCELPAQKTVGWTGGITFSNFPQKKLNRVVVVEDFERHDTMPTLENLRVSLYIIICGNDEVHIKVDYHCNIIPSSNMWIYACEE